MYLNNKGSVFKVLLENKNISRADISRLLHLNKPSVSRIVQELIDDGWVVEKKLVDSNSKVGKNPILLNLNRNKKILGIQINEFKSTFIISDLYGDISHKEIIQIRSGKYFKEDFDNSLRMIKNKYKYNFVAISIVLPGIINHSVIHFSYDLNIKDFDITYISKEIFPDIPLFLENDSRAAALSEKNFSDVGLKDFFYVLFKVDYKNSILYVGSSFIIHNEIVRGFNNFAGEIIDLSYTDDGIKHIKVHNDLTWEMDEKLSSVILKELGRLFVFLNPEKVIFGGNISQEKSGFIEKTEEMIERLKNDYYTYDVSFAVSKIKNPVELGTVAVVIDKLKNSEFRF